MDKDQQRIRSFNQEDLDYHIDIIYSRVDDDLEEIIRLAGCTK